MPIMVSIYWKVSFEQRMIADKGGIMFMETDDQKIKKLRDDCWDNALHCFGTSYIFSKRAVRYGSQLTFLKVFGIVVPVAVGVTASGYGLDSELLKSTVAVSIPLSIIQVIYSIFAFGYNWDNNLAYSYESVIDHNNLSEEFKKLAKRPPSNYSEFYHDFSILDAKLNTRLAQDAKHSLTERELRMGMKFALREFKRPCYGCRQIPISMNSTTCPVCGKYRRSIIQQIFNYG